VFSRLFRKAAPDLQPDTAGRLVYAIGDIHGRHDLLEPLLADILHDADATGPAEPPILIFLGDYVDRGPASRQVVETILALCERPGLEVRTLKGNHEEALLQYLDDTAFGPTWMEHGGGTTLSSYGVSPPATRTDPLAWAATRDAFLGALPPEHLGFFQSLELMVTVGDYAFVHAGVRPGAPLDRQAEKDLLWIRGEFLQAKGPFEKVIVHGHTPMQEPQILKHRLGLDTGAYATGVLTAARLDDIGPRLMQARARRG